MSEHIGEQTVDVPVPHTVKEIREMIVDIPQRRFFSERIEEQIVDAHVSQVAKEILEEIGEEIV